MELSNAAAAGIARLLASRRACTGGVITDGMKALFVEGSDFLAKPCDMEQLSTKVAEMVSGNQFRARRG